MRKQNDLNLTVYLIIFFLQNIFIFIMEIVLIGEKIKYSSKFGYILDNI